MITYLSQNWSVHQQTIFTVVLKTVQRTILQKCAKATSHHATQSTPVQRKEKADMTSLDQNGWLLKREGMVSLQKDEALKF